MQSNVTYQSVPLRCRVLIATICTLLDTTHTRTAPATTDNIDITIGYPVGVKAVAISTLHATLRTISNAVSPEREIVQIGEHFSQGIRRLQVTSGDMITIINLACLDREPSALGRRPFSWCWPSRTCGSDAAC